jgi:3-phenylpropionate/trans-cinnamate dioxygenase ferredoxin subunit
MFRKVGQVSALKPDEITATTVGDEQIALYKVDGDVYATTDVCPHSSCLLSENGDVFEGAIECSCHGSSFDLRTGTNINPPSADPLRTYQVTVEGDDVLIDFGPAPGGSSS